APPAWYGFLPDQTSPWRVRVPDAKASVGTADPSWGPWSPDRRFRTPVASAATIGLAEPPGGADVNNFTPLLRWVDSNPSVWYYEIQLSQDAGFETEPGKATAAVYWELIHGGVTNPPRSYRVSSRFPLAEGMPYYWRVRPRVQGDGRPAAWSPIGRFQTPAMYAMGRVSSDSPATVTIAAGVQAMLAIPSGAVQHDAAGAPGTVAFTIARNMTLPVALPAGAAALGWAAPESSFTFGPVGFTLERPVTVSLAAPQGTLPGQAALYRYDLLSGAWVSLGGDLDPVTGRIFATVYHLGTYTVAVLPAAQWQARRADAPGGVALTNSAAANSGVWLSLCVDPAASTLLKPNFDPGWNAGGLGGLAAPPGTTGWVTTAPVRLPQGAYRILITRHSAQGASWSAWPDLVAVDTPDRLATLNADPAAMTWTPGRAACAGPALAAVGTGDVQVTLSWGASLDLDLAVTEPGGEQVWFGAKTSAAGGRLDRDTHCGNFQMGRPENIYWSGPTTPRGRFRVTVTYYRDCESGGAAAAYAVRLMTGDRARTVYGRLPRAGDENASMSFVYP
ncbi:MAG: hypothetical protein NTZ05_08305, partial [Chloroflexi bacterium]|nr:hypothetical protein [Chloroflexota bacterium]